MNNLVLILGVLFGWSFLLLLPYALTGSLNPLDSGVGWLIVVPPAIPVWLWGEGGARVPIRSFSQKRSSWLESQTSFTKVKLFSMGLLSGLAFAIPSAIMIALAILFAFLLINIWAIVIVCTVGLFHLFVFYLSFVGAFYWVKKWARRIHARNRREKSVRRIT